MRGRRTTLGDVCSVSFEELKRRMALVATAKPAVPTSPPATLLARPVEPSEPSMWIQKRTRRKLKLKPKQSAGSLKQPDLDISVYGGTAHLPEPARVQRKPLSELSADMTRLKIRASKSEASINQPLRPVPVGGQRTAILGLDFGTAFTKAVVRFDQKHYVVDWSGVVTARDPHLLPSSFSEHKNGTVILGGRLGSGWSRREGIKMRLLAFGIDADDDARCDAVLFIALVFRYVATWFPKICKGARAPRWKLHLGLPAESWDDQVMASLFGTLAEAGLELACGPAAMSRKGARDALQVAGVVPHKVVAVLPEFACQLYSYLDSAQRQSDIHALMDVGAGTLDVAFFNVHSEDEEDVLPILSATVKTLGTHHLIGALAGKPGEQLEWRDDDAAAHDEEVATRICEDTDKVNVRRRAYLSALARTFGDAQKQARVKYPSSRAWQGGAPVDLFLCGGGSRLPTIREHILSLVRDAKKTLGLTIRIVPLPRPQNLEGGLREDQYDRVSVAYGLSQLPGNVGRVIHRHDLEPLDMPLVTEIEDRDATR